VLAEPEVAREPLHAPEAVHAVASVDDQERFELPPDVTVCGLADRETVGAGCAAVTLTVTDLEALPPVPEQAKVNVVVEFSGPIDCVPLVDFAPDQPPDAVQLFAFVVLQLNVEFAPLATVVGLALSVNVGAGVTTLLTVTDIGLALPTFPPASRATAVML
jgi:hypothetical protein